MLTEIPKHQKGDAQKRDHYDSISTETRRMLVKLTQEDGVSIRKASKALQIKYSTGKTLIQLYKKTGRIDRVKQQRAKTIEAKHQVRKII
jgi:transposase